ncbi:hypothetical protein [Cryobacterium sp. TMT2-42-4]|uniref:hypothetical protein n=1 Tax=Cryobacterium sp. TMT2-42-4 TaxID=1259255 RepID=UPI00106DCCFA|nr:hypothetical protein [Cryobacterium sp. TMT2-42-4]TFC37674.1 hypothetical protein E3O18_05070 [Cryobacterium sp. TMT2-42-4]
MDDMKFGRRQLTLYERRARARNADCDPETLRALARDRDVEVRSSIAAHPQTASGVLRRLARTRDVVVRWHVAINPSAPREVLLQLVSDMDRCVRVWAASNENLRASDLLPLALNGDKFTQIGVAWNRNTPRQTLVLLASDTEEDVRDAVFQRWQITNDTQRIADAFRAAFRPNQYERLGATRLVGSEFCEVLLALTGDEDPEVRQSAVDSYLGSIHIDSLAKLATRGSDDMDFERFIASARNSRPNGDLQAQGARNYADVAVEKELRRRASQLDYDPSAAAGILRAATHGTMLGVVQCLAENPTTSGVLLDSILREWIQPQALASTDGNHPNHALYSDWTVKELACSLAANPSTLPQSLRILARHNNLMVRLHIAKRAREPAVGHLAHDFEEHVRMSAAMNPELSPDNLTRLASDESLEVRARVVGNPSTPVDTLRDVVHLHTAMLERARSQRPPGSFGPTDRERLILSILGNAAYNTAMPEDILDELARTVIGGLASNPNTSPDTLAALGLKGRSREDLAKNPRTPVDTLRILTNWALAETLSSNYYEAQSLLTLLAGIASNPSSPTETVGEVAQKLTDLDVAKLGTVELEDFVAPATFFSAMVNAIHDPMRFGRPGNSHLAAPLARNPRTPSDGLRLLAERSDPSVREGVAGNSATPLSVLLLLSEDPAPPVRKSAARNPNLPTAVLHRLASDEDFGVREAVAECPRTPAESLTRLASDTVLRVRIAAEENAKTPSGALLRGRLATAMHVQTAAVRLLALALDPEPEVRWATAANPNTPPDTLDALAQDEFTGVRRAVTGNRSARQRTLTILAADPALFAPDSTERHH